MRLAALALVPVPVPSRSLPSPAFAFPPEVMVLAVRWYLHFGLSFRDVEELLAKRGVEVDHVSVYRWVQRFTPLLAEAARPYRHAVGNRWQGSNRDLYRELRNRSELQNGRAGAPPCVTLTVPPA